MTFFQVVYISVSILMRFVRAAILHCMNLLCGAMNQ